MKNICFLTFLFLFISCDSVQKPHSDWMEVDKKVSAKDSLDAENLLKKTAGAVETWAGYPDTKKDSLGER